MTSIIEESKKAKTNGILGFWRSKKFIYIAIAVIIVGCVWFFGLASSNKNNAESAAPPKEWTVKKDDIVVSVQADGKVVAEDGVELSFSLNDDNLEVKNVYVKEGAEIKKGDKIASVSTDSLQLSLNSAWTSYQSALADYNETIAGPTEEEKQDAQDKITNAEISLEQAKQSLETTKRNSADSIYNAEQNVKDAKKDYDDNKDINTSKDVFDVYKILVDTIKSIDITLEGDLPESDEIIGVDNKYINDDFENNLGVKNISTLSIAKASYNQVKKEKEILDELVASLSYSSSYDDINTAAEQASKTLELMEKHLYDMRDMLNASITSVNLSQSALDSYKSTITSNRSGISTEIATLNDDINDVADAKEAIEDYRDDYDDALRDLENVKADAQRDIDNAKSNIISKELSLEQTKRSYDDLIAPLTDAELASARSKLTSASVSLQKAQNALDEATLFSPIEGQVVELNYKTGDIIVDNDDPVAVILNSDTLFVEVNVEEADVSKLKVGQKAVATFDALDSLELDGEISFISLTSKTSNNGIVTYEVRVLINNPSEKQIREGMTAYIDFVTAEARDILVVPIAAVRNVGGQPSVQKISGEWVPVTTGFTDGKYVEIISGLNAGDNILY